MPDCICIHSCAELWVYASTSPRCPYETYGSWWNDRDCFDYESNDAWKYSLSKIVKKFPVITKLWRGNIHKVCHASEVHTNSFDASLLTTFRIVWYMCWIALGWWAVANKARPAMHWISEMILDGYKPEWSETLSLNLLCDCTWYTNSVQFVLFLYVEIKRTFSLFCVWKAFRESINQPYEMLISNIRKNKRYTELITKK